MGVLTSDENELKNNANINFDQKSSITILNMNDTDAQSTDNNAPINATHVSLQPNSEFDVCIDSKKSNTDIEVVSPPSPYTREERVQMLQELLEMYFRDNYLSGDIFLLKHFKKSKDGWLSFKFVAAYKCIKRRSRNISEVIEAVENSTVLEFNKEKTKVRRTVPLPSCIYNYIPTRMALVGGLPDTLRSLTSASQILSPYGTVESLHLLRPGGILPEHLLDTADAHPELREQWCLVVQFEDMHAAGEMVEAITRKKCEPGQPTWACELVMPWRKRKNESTKGADLSSGYSSCQDSNVSSPQPTPKGSPSLRNHRKRGLTKRERMATQSKSPVSSSTSSPRHQLTTNSYNLQPQTQHKFSTHTQLLNTNNIYYCSRKSASECDNWRTAPAF